jgi:hypothetical protein
MLLSQLHRLIECPAAEVPFVTFHAHPLQRLAHCRPGCSRRSYGFVGGRERAVQHGPITPGCRRVHRARASASAQRARAEQRRPSVQDRTRGGQEGNRVPVACSTRRCARGHERTRPWGCACTSPPTCPRLRRWPEHVQSSLHKMNMPCTLEATCCLQAVERQVQDHVQTQFHP